MGTTANTTAENSNNEKNYRRIVIDVDGTLCADKSPETSYTELKPNQEVINRLREYQKNGFYIIIYSSRQMRTYNNNIGRITAKTVPVLLDWLNKYNIPYDEVFIGKPWCGFEGFYVDDKTIRPDEFLEKSYQEIQRLLKSTRKEKNK